MQAIVIGNDGAASSLLLREVPDPVPGPGDLIVEVQATALNRADLRRAPSHFAGSENRAGPAVGGLEMAGVVIAAGPGVRGFLPGDRVMAMTGGAWAQRARVDHRLALPVPRGYGWAEAAATPVSFITAHDALVSAAGVRADEAVLVRGASSAVGLAAIQIARELGAGAVFGTTNSREKLGPLADLGCVPLQSGPDGVAADIHRLTDGRGVEVVIDIVGAGAVQDNIDAASVACRIVCLGRLAGTEGTFNLDEFARKRIRMVGVTFRTRTLEERIAAVGLFREQMIDGLASRAVHPVIDRVFPFHAIEDAERYMRENHNFGKVIIEVGAG